MIIDYFPVDEEHRTHTTDVYSFSKELVEDIGAYYWRRMGISSLALRFPAVWPSERMTNPEVARQRAQARALIDEFAAQPETERLARLAKLQKATQAFRAKRYLEYPLAKEGIKRDGHSDDPLWPIYAIDRFNFWAYVDERDSAQAVAKGLIADYTGAHALFINAQSNSLNYDSQALVKLFFPDIAAGMYPLQGAESLVSIAKAKSLIGYAPEHTLEVKQLR